MSRTGKLPITIPAGVSVEHTGNLMHVKGKAGTLSLPLTTHVDVQVEGNVIHVRPSGDTKRARAMWGTTRSLLNGMVTGLSQGYTRQLDIIGVGFRAAVDGNVINLSLGYSHEIRYVVPEGVKVTSEKPTVLVLSSHNKQLLGQVASELRALRKPEPYKGKGVRYANEVVRIKEGKKK